MYNFISSIWRDLDMPNKGNKWSFILCNDDRQRLKVWNLVLKMFYSFWIRGKNSYITDDAYQCCCMSVFATSRSLFECDSPKTRKNHAFCLSHHQEKKQSVYIHVSPKIKKCYLQNVHASSTEVNWVHRINCSSTFMTSHNNHVLCSTRCLLWFLISRAPYIEWWLLSN